MHRSTSPLVLKATAPSAAETHLPKDATCRAAQLAMHLLGNLIKMSDKFLQTLPFCFVDFGSITRIKSDFSSTSPLYFTGRSEAGEKMPRFYFHLISNETRITDDGGKAFDTLNDAHEHGRKLIDKILLHVGYDDADEWKVIVSNDEDDAQLIIPFTVSYLLSSTRRAG